ncbi:hypothetical protein P2318_32170 [Myxococcaceae bacterium GXIMD 01537]
MSADDSERKRARPPVSSQGIDALLERWVSELERDDPWSEARVEAPRGKNRANVERPSPLEETRVPPEREAPEEHAPKAHAPVKRAPAETPPHATEKVRAIRAARAEIRVQGSVVTVPQNSPVAVERTRERLVHRGTVAIRGPCAPSRAELVGLGVTEPQARALEFVLAWFGSPLDALSGGIHGGPGPGWGSWPLSGELLGRALSRWKGSDPSNFEASIGRFGIDVLDDGEGPPELSVLSVEEGHPVHGREALALLEDDVRLFAALARAGRERGAQLAQLACIIESILQPLLASAERSRETQSPAEELFSTPLALALLLHAELRLGRRGSTRFAVLARGEAGKPDGDASAGHRFVSLLQTAGRSREASEVQLILSSPELAATLAS